MEGRAHFEKAIALYDPTEHRPLATRFGVTLGCQPCAIGRGPCGFLGYPEAALADADRALKRARELGQAATLMYALFYVTVALYLVWKLRGRKRESR